MSLPLVLAVALLAQAQGNSAPPSSAPAGPPIEFESYQLVILQRPEHPREYPEEKLAEIQKEHLAHLGHLAEAGKLVVADPLGDQPDLRWRGIALFHVGGIEEAKRLAEEDPAVKAGRLEAVVMTWLTEKGAMTFPIAEKLRKP
ncbi:MAG TPA: YciI family protein [Thermoanaerobaculia bacterium]|jgi:uncharacterized protein YciI|nr:YciI family protein [Thermoanaerobaculia bacterium]